MSNVNRRYFLMGSLAAAEAGRSALAQSSEVINSAFIGTGNRGSALLAGTLKEQAVKVVAVCDLKPDRLDKAATTAARDKPDTYADWRRIIDRKDVQAVFIATPCDLHVEMALAAFQAGKHIYCEKPIGVTAESVNRLWRAGRDSKLVFQTGLGLRSSARNQQVIGKLHSGVAGKVIMIRAHRTASDDLDHNGPSKDWFFNAKRSGDVIVEMAVHNLDVCNWIADSRPAWAAGSGGALVWPDDPPGRTNMDGYTLTYEYANGVKLSFTQVFFHPNGMPGGGQGFWVYGVNGGVDLSTGTYYPRQRGAAQVKLLEGGEGPGGSSQYDSHITGFFKAIRTGAPVTAPLKVGCLGTLTSIIGREAIYQKRMVHWADLKVDASLG